MFSLCNGLPPATHPIWCLAPWSSTQMFALQVLLGFAVVLRVSKQICMLGVSRRCTYLSYERGQLPRCCTSGCKAKMRCFPLLSLIIKGTQELYHSSMGSGVTARVSFPMFWRRAYYSAGCFAATGLQGWVKPLVSAPLRRGLC